jgi:hypothetical protein
MWTGLCATANVPPEARCRQCSGALALIWETVIMKWLLSFPTPLVASLPLVALVALLGAASGMSVGSHASGSQGIVDSIVERRRGSLFERRHASQQHCQDVHLDRPVGMRAQGSRHGEQRVHVGLVRGQRVRKPRHAQDGASRPRCAPRAPPKRVTTRSSSRCPTSTTDRRDRGSFLRAVRSSACRKFYIRKYLLS